VSTAHSTTANPSTTGSSSSITGEASSSLSSSRLSSQAGDDDEVDETQMVSDQPAAQTVFQRSDRPPNPLDFYKLLLLEAREGESRVVVGGLILEARARQVARVSSELLQGIAGQVVSDDVVDAEAVFEQGLGVRIREHMDHPEKITGLTTGITEFDKAIDGFMAGRVYLYGAETSMGKSLFGQDVVRRLSKQGHRCLVFTTEMGREAFLWRIAFQEAGLDPQAHRGGYTTGDKDRVQRVMELVSQLPNTL
jgi:hypothetical protein